MRPAPSLQTYVAEIAEHLRALLTAAPAVLRVSAEDATDTEVLDALVGAARQHEQDFGALPLPAPVVTSEWLPFVDQAAVTVTVPISWALATRCSDDELVDEIGKLLHDTLQGLREQANTPSADVCTSCGGAFDSPGCVVGPGGRASHTHGAGVGAAR